MLTLPRLVLRAGDRDPLVLAGQGVVHVPDLYHFTFELTGEPVDLSFMFSAVRRMQAERYNGLARLRLEGIDEDGIDWTFGWTQPRINHIENKTWQAVGSLDALSPNFEVDDDTDLSTELIYTIENFSPMSLVLTRALPSELNRPGFRSRSIMVLGAELNITYETNARILSIRASPSEALPLLFAENRLSEPLRILFGQPMSPRLVARNRGNRRPIVFIARTARVLPHAGWAALWDWEKDQTEDFWPMFSQLLTFLIRSRGPTSDLEPHMLTRFYEEISQASTGSHWVWAMTFASTIEGLVKMIAPDPTSVNATEMEAFAEYIRAWRGDSDFIGVAIAAIRNTQRSSAPKQLKTLQRERLVSQEQVAAWNAVRNRVMHGTLLSRYSVKVEDDQLVALSTLTHNLTRILLDRQSPRDARTEADQH